MNCRDIACFLYEVPTHGVAGVMGRVTLDAGQAADLVEHRMEKPRSAILKSFYANLWPRARHVEFQFQNLQLYTAPRTVYR